MKTVQRERRYVCGQTKQNAVYQEIEIYTVGTDQKSRQREKQKVTPVPFRGKNPEHWDGHNAKRARKWFIRLLNTNFTEADTHTSLTYSDEFLPKTEEEADRDISNFLRRLRTKCKARGLPAPEAITVTEHQDADPDTGQKAVRFHHHVILKCQLTRDEIEGCWVRKKKRMGTTNADRLQMDKSSLEALANYLMKYPKRKHRWRRTRGIRDPSVFFRKKAYTWTKRSWSGTWISRNISRTVFWSGKLSVSHFITACTKHPGVCGGLF